MAKNNNYTSSTFWLALLVVVILVGLSFIPSWNIGGKNIKRANIVSELFELGGESVDSMAEVCDSLMIDSSVVSKPVDSTLCKPNVIKGQNWSLSSSSSKPVVANKPADVPETKECRVDIEEFAPMDSQHSMTKFYKKLQTGKGGRPIRIAVIGDSFIEGDIFSADIRELLQKIYLGSGPGFVPTSSPVAQYRGTVKHKFSNWKTHSILKIKSAPQQYKDRFYVSGMLATPMEGATVRYEGVRFKENLKSWTATKLLFINEMETELKITINDTVTRSFKPESSPNLQHISIDGDISSLSMSVSKPNGFISYGVVLDSDIGISVDNYGLRGNSGLSLISANTTICRQINEILDYDFVILEYGLNVLSANISNYNNYAMQMSRVVEHIKSCFPNSAIMVCGVSDRSVQRNGAFETMPTLLNMLDAQRSIAKKCGVAFWSIYDAMGGKNSMVGFVAKGWGAKDYTHISYAGGKRIAQEFVVSLLKSKDEYVSKRKSNGGLEYTVSSQSDKK